MTKSSQKLQQFRNKAYQLLGPAKDAIFELMDAVLLTRKVHSFAELSLSPVFRRKWCSLYVRAACPFGTQRSKIVGPSVKNY